MFHQPSAPFHQHGAGSFREISNVDDSRLFSVAEANELARILCRLPERLRVYGIEGQQFDLGARFSPEVERAIERWFSKSPPLVM
jgi:hypothetical protein